MTKEKVKASIKTAMMIEAVIVVEEVETEIETLRLDLQ